MDGSRCLDCMEVQIESFVLSKRLMIESACTRNSSDGSKGFVRSFVQFYAR
jgi:hypothetical protein